MKQVVVEEFGGVDQLKLIEVPTPEPGPGQVRVRLTSIGLNHAEIMTRRGTYRLSSGDPPFTPGLEGGGFIEAVGEGVDRARLDQRVTLSPAAPRRLPGTQGGTYRTHAIVQQDDAMPAPDALPDEQLGAVWLSYLTAWGCLVWKDQLRSGQVVALAAASGAVALAAAQIARQHGATTLGLTSHSGKIGALQALDTAAYDHLLGTHELSGSMKPWHRAIKAITDGRGVDLFFDPVGGGEHLSTEILCLAQHGCIWIYGLLAKPGVVDMGPLIRKQASIRGWVLSELIAAGESQWRPACEAIFQGIAQGIYRQNVGGTFALEDVQEAHATMERGEHVGKLVLLP